MLNSPPRPLTGHHRGSQKAEKHCPLHGPARPNLRGEDGQMDQWSEMQAKGEMKMLQENSRVSWCPRCGAGPRSFKGQVQAAGTGGAGTQEAAPPRSALTSRGGPGGDGTSRWQFAPVQSPGWSGSGAGVGNKADEGMKGEGR